MSRELDRLVRQALRGDTSAVLRWHEENKDRFDAARGPRSPVLGPDELTIIGPGRIAGGEFMVRALVDGADLDDDVTTSVAIIVWADRARLRLAGSRLEVCDLYTKWTALPSGKIHSADVLIQDPGTDLYLYEESQEYGKEIGEQIRPFVLAWAEDNAEGLKRLLATSLLLEAREFAQMVEETEKHLAQQRAMLVETVADEIRMRFSSWRPM